MAKRPTPVLMLSAHTKEGAKETLDALAAGAIDFLTKPSGEVSADFQTLAPALVEKLVEVSGTSPRVFTPIAVGAQRRRAGLSTWPPSGPKVCVIGVSTGGPTALTRVIPELPGDIPLALIVVQHMPAQFTGALAERLAAQSSIVVQEAKDGDRPRPSMALIAPGDRHLEIADGGVIRIHDGPEVNGCRPSVDVTMKSAARVFGRRAVGLVMTGMGRDGAEGLAAIKSAGGQTFAQDRESSVIWGMPRAAVELGAASEVLGLDHIADRLAKIV
jgi:two-component system chemotaxis response regulator CheB